MGLLSFLRPGTSLKELLRKGAVIIDVRTPNEFDRGKIPDSINIPVDRIASNAERIRQIKHPVIFCCSSGERSRQAVAVMKKNKKADVYNGGDWEKLYETWKAI
jgi:phage shock protein E